MRTSYTLLSGASSAIGRAIAAQVSRSRRLILHGRDEGKLAQVRNGCHDPEIHRLWPYNLTDMEGLSASLEALLTGPNIVVEAFVHCAAILQLGAFRLMAPAVEAEIFTVNFFSAVEIIRTLLSSKSNHDSLSNVLMISSGASLFGEKGNVAYSASKGAIDSFVKSLAIDLAPSGRANSILPGMVDGGMSDLSRQSSSYEKVIAANYPLGIGRTSDVAGLVDFLLSENSRWITGQQILVDGGYGAHCNHAV